MFKVANLRNFSSTGLLFSSQKDFYTLSAGYPNVVFLTHGEQCRRLPKRSVSLAKWNELYTTEFSHVFT